MGYLAQRSWWEVGWSCELVGRRLATGGMPTLRYGCCRSLLLRPLAIATYGVHATQAHGMCPRHLGLHREGVLTIATVRADLAPAGVTDWHRDVQLAVKLAGSFLGAGPQVAAML